jgi:PmbA protein
VVSRDGESEESYEMFDKLDESLSDYSKKAVDGALAKLGAKEIESGKYDVIFSAKQTRALLSTFSGVFSGRSAQLGLSLFAGKEGQKVASDCITIVDDPRREGCAQQTSFDGEGVATYKKTVIENGVLNTLLYDLSSAKKAGIESTANGQRTSYASPVTIEPYSFYIKGGEKSFDELCESVEDGIYITALKGLHAGANAVTGDFSIDSEGFRIKDGKICEAIKSFTVAGNFFELLRSIEDLSSEVTFGLPSGFTSYGAPEILVRKMSIAGK